MTVMWIRNAILALYHFAVFMRIIWSTMRETIQIFLHSLRKLKNDTKWCTIPTCAKVKKLILLKAMGINAAGHINVCKLWTRKSSKLIDINTLSSKASNIMHHWGCLHCTCSNASSFDVRKHIAKSQFKKSRVNTTRVLSNGQSGTLAVKIGITGVQTLICLGNYLSQDRCIVYGYLQKNHARSCNYDWTEAISKLHGCSREWHAKRIVDLQHVENFELNEIQA